jgi:hypothetical protein
VAGRGDFRPAPGLSGKADRIQSLAVTREGTRPFAAFIAAALVAALLAACGGSDSDSSGSTEATTTGASATSGSAAGSDGGSRSPSRARQDDGQDRQNQGEAEDDQSQDRQGSDGGSGSGNVETPLEVSGGGSEQFRTKGGDNSIQEYGDEGDESELQEVAEIVHGFYVARAEEDWDTACSYLAKSNVEQLEQLGAQSPQFKGSGCAPVLKAFTRPLAAAVQREVTTVDAGSFRRDGEQGFLIYYGAGQTVYAMPLRDEGGSWKVAALSGSALG